VKLLKDKAEDVRQAAFAGLATASNWRYEEAQQHLARIAKQKSAAIDDRIAAIQGLGKTVKLQFHGNFEDKIVLWTLVLCLDDDELRVRESAFAQLEKGVKDTFEYKPELEAPQRKSSVGKWKSWTATKVGPLEALARP
jgi:hypothetical protein